MSTTLTSKALEPAYTQGVLNEVAHTGHALGGLGHTLRQSGTQLLNRVAGALIAQAETRARNQRFGRNIRW